MDTPLQRLQACREPFECVGKIVHKLHPMKKET
jgi:hypothetical protein